MIDHDRAQELAAAALDFDLSSTDREGLRQHLESCGACRAVDDGLRADAQALATMAPIDASNELRARIPGLAPARSPSHGADDAREAEIVPRRLFAFPPRHLFTIPPRYQRPAGMVAAAAVVIALIGGSLFWRAGPGTEPDVAAASPSASSPSTSGSVPPGSPLPSIEPDKKLAASPHVPVADLTADDVQGGVAGLASGFRLTSLGSTPAAELARHLTVEPGIEYIVTPDADERSVRITPTEPLTPGAVYRFTLQSDEGLTLDTWAFQAHQPLRIVGTLPENTQTDVPADTGIEVTFDQDGIVDAASHISIEPRVDGRFEQHGRVIAFVPARPLDPATLYTVTVTKGVEVEATGERLEEDLRFQFETSAEGASVKDQVTFQFSDDVFESATADRPTIALWAFQEGADPDNAPPPPTSAPIEIYRFPDLDAAIAGFREIRSSPRWARWSTSDLVPTSGLTRVVGFDAKLQDSEGVLWFQVPERLPEGWYLLMVPSPTRPIQALLQVTDIAGYLVVSDTRTLVWANDLATGAPVAGAFVRTEGVDLGRTDQDGSLLAATPASLLPERDGTCAGPCAPVVTVRSGDRAAFLPATGRRDPNGKDSIGSDGSVASRYWQVFDTDRTLYRRTDTVNTWGVVRDRDTGRVPEAVTIGLFASENEGYGSSGPPLSTTEVRPNAIGVFTGSIPLDDLPEGWYALQLRVRDAVVASSSFQVDRILKPAYRLDVTTGRRVYFAGDQIRVTARATFYEGSPVPGVPLRLEGLVDKSITTDETGTATLRTTAAVEEDSEGGTASTRSVQITPARAEEGEIAGASREIVVFPSSWTLDANAQVRDGRVRVTGDLSAIDRDRLERELAAGKDLWELDPGGDAVARATVTVTFTEAIFTRVQRGTRYDFIEKQVVPTYEIDSSERVVGTVKVKTDTDGHFTASIKASSDTQYEVRLSATDPDAHAARWSAWVNEQDYREIIGRLEASLKPTSGGLDSQAEFGVGETIDLTMSVPGAADGDVPARYLFYSAQRGIHAATIQASARYQATFDASAPPDLTIAAVSFTGSRYVESTGFQASFRSSDRRLTVGLKANADRYRPGDEVTLTVTTRDRAGDPVAATVVLRAVDEKLFGIGGAAEADPLGRLYEGVGSGVRATYLSHRSPRGDDGSGGGDTTGGGGRETFRDTILFRTVETGSDGRAIVTFKVADDLTSWRVGASALGEGLTAGEGSIAIPVGLPFFADVTIAPEYLLSDRPEIGLRAFGTALKAGVPVTFAVDSEGLGLHVKGIRADAFETVTVPLPKLTIGTHKVTITARTGSGDSARQDRLTRTFAVVDSRLTRSQSSYLEPTGSTRLDGGPGLTEIIVSDPGAGAHVPLLVDLAWTDSARLERALAAAEAASILKDGFDVVGPTAAAEFDGATYQTLDGGLAVVPYASSDLEATALATLVAPDRFDRPRLEAYLSTIAGNDGETRERRIYALAGLAGVGAGVLPEIQAAAAEPGFTIRERLMLGLGAAALGDATTARSIAAGLVEDYGEAVDDQARLRVGDSAADITAATALMAVLAAETGDPLAHRFWAYVEANLSAEAPHELLAVGYIASVLERQPHKPVSFAYVIGGERSVVDLEPGETFRMSVTARQLDTLRLEPVNGAIGVTTSWRERVDATAFERDPDLTISRRVTPGGTIETGDLVIVDLDVELGPKAPTDCHLVTDHLPSGLVAVGNLEAWVDPDNGESPPARDVSYPYAQVGQRVSFCAGPITPGATVARLRYVARVVTPGTYTWEPAVVESQTAAGRAALTEPSILVIR